MKALAKKIAKYLVKNWRKLPNAVKWAIEQIASSALVEAVSRGVEAVCDKLLELGETVIKRIASLLGLA